MRSICTFLALATTFLFTTNVSATTVDEKDKNGWTIVYGKDKPGSGYGDECKVEEGEYVNNRKEGKWIKYHKDCDKPRLIGTFKDGRPSGPYEKIDESGIVREKGVFVDGHQIDDFERMNENGIVVLEKSFDSEGNTDGKVVHYYDDGRIQMEAEFVKGVATGREITYYENGDIKRIREFAEDGTVASTDNREMVNPPVQIMSNYAETREAPDPFEGDLRGKRFKPQKYNKVYTKSEELWQDGLFKNGKIWDGQIYVYDSDGLLERIEVWKEGRYHSDGQLEK